MIEAVQLTSELLRVRNNVRSILGDRWGAKLDEYRPVFALAMQFHDCTELEAVGHIQRATGGPVPEMVMAVLIAVAVELVEARK